MSAEIQPRPHGFRAVTFARPHRLYPNDNIGGRNWQGDELVLVQDSLVPCLYLILIHEPQSVTLDLQTRFKTVFGLFDARSIIAACRTP